MAEPFTIYKLTILYMLDKSEIPLTNTQIINFFLELEYTNYFNIQEVIGQLLDADLIRQEAIRNTTQYRITQSGKEALGFFRSKISEGIEQDVKEYFEKNKWEFRRENYVVADFIPLRDNHYQVVCQVRSDGDSIIELKLNVGSKAEAQTICNHWKNKNEDVYAYLMDMLLI